MNWIRKYALKKWITDEVEIQKLEDFFNIPEIKEQLKEFGKNRTRTYIILITICVIILVSKTGKDSPTVLFMTPFLILGISAMLFPRKTYKTIMSFLEKKEAQLKETAIKYNNFASKIRLILNNLAKLCCDKIEYDGGPKYAFWELDRLKEVGIINSYSDARMNNSLVFLLEKNGKKALVKWYELDTRDWKNTTNHCYLLKTTIPNIKTNIEKDIYIKSELKTSNDKHSFINIFIVFIIFICYFIYMHNFIFMQNWKYSSILIIFILILIAIIMSPILPKSNFLKSYFFSNKINLENIDFEKLYNVYSEDQITSRMIVTPAFMDRLILLTRRTKRKYTFLFRNNYFYIKWELNGPYLRLNTWDIFKKNVDIFIDWYAEIKEIISFVEDMKILYLSKTKAEFLVENETPSEDPLEYKAI